MVGLVYSIFLLSLFFGLGRFHWLSPDSWLLQDLASGVEFWSYSSFITRGFVSTTYSAPFPIGYPLIISALYGSIEAVVIFNIFCFFLSYIILFSLLKSRYPELKEYLSLLCLAPFLYYPYIAELLGARTIPFVILLQLGALGIVLSAPRYMQDKMRCVAFNFSAGLLLGFAISVRIDGLAAVAALLLCELFRRRIMSIFILGIGITIGVLPWLIFSWVVFGELYSSDNSWVSLSFGQYHSQDFYSSLAGGIDINFSIVLASVLSYLKSLFVVVFIFATPLAFYLLTKCMQYKNVKNSYIALFFLCYFFLKSVILISTGYFDYRYFSFSVILLFILAISDVKFMPGFKFWLSISLMVFFNAGMIGYQYLKKSNLGVNDFECVAEYVEQAIDNKIPIFDDSNFGSYFAYSRKIESVLLPTNFEDISQEEKTKFEEKFFPFRYHVFTVDLDKSGCGKK